jgi:hypothetical protein
MWICFLCRASETDRIRPFFINLNTVHRTRVFAGSESAHSIGIIRSDRRRQGRMLIDRDAGFDLDLKLDWTDPEAIPITQLDLPNDSCPIDKGPILTVEILDQRPVTPYPQNTMTLTDDKTTRPKVASSIPSDREGRAHHRNGPAVPFTGRHCSQMNSHMTPFVDKTLPVLPIKSVLPEPILLDR